VLLSPGAGAGVWPPPVPAELTLTVRETAGVARSAEVVVSGVPLPRALGVTEISGLTVVDATGEPVPAQFEVLARWHAARNDATAAIQWLLVSFAASVPAHESRDYQLVLDGSAGPNPPPDQALVLSSDGDRITVDTGAAVFVIAGNATALFDEVWSSTDSVVVSGGAMTADVQQDEVLHEVVRSVRIERLGPLAAAVVVDGRYDMAAVGGGGLGSQRRYELRAGSPVAVVRHAAQWEGDRCGLGELECGGEPNAVLLNRIRDTLSTTLGPGRSVMIAGARGGPWFQGPAGPGDASWVRQHLRVHRLAPLSFDVHVPGTGGASGSKADGALLAVGDGEVSVAIALDHMHRFEPQALRLLETGELAVDLVDDSAWLGARQGMFANLAVGVFAGDPDPSALEREVWARLNHP